MSTTITDAGGGSSLVRLLRVLRRRKWLVILPPVVLLVLALGRSFSQDELYKGQADVLLSRVSLQNMVDNQTVVGITGDQFFRIQKTQAFVARSPIVAQPRTDGDRRR